jgi:cyclase
MPRLPRFTLLALLLALVLGVVGWRAALAQSPAAPPPEPAAAQTQPAPTAEPPAEPTAEPAAEPAAEADPKAVTSAVVRGPVGVITNEGGNIGVLSGPDGILLVDAGFARQAEPIRAAIAALAPPPQPAPPAPAAKPAAPRLLVSTHFHADHTDGNAGFVATGALIVAHENTHRRLAEGSMLEAFQLVTPPADPAHLPPITFERDLRLRLNGETIDLLHLPAAHTDGDVIVRFRNADVIHAADVWFNGMYPFIDTRHGATLAGAIAGVDRVLLLAGDDTRIIPGHGPVGSRAELATYRAMLANVQGRLSALKAQGFTLPQVLEARPLADLEATWGQGLFTGDRWLELLWNGV